MSQSVFGCFFWTLFFSLQPSIGGIWVYFWDLVFSEFGGVGFDTSQVFGYFGCDFRLVLIYVIFWFYFRTLSFFSVSPLGLLGFFGLVIFLAIWYRGLVFYSEFGCLPFDIY